MCFTVFQNEVNRSDSSRTLNNAVHHRKQIPFIYPIMQGSMASGSIIS